MFLGEPLINHGGHDERTPPMSGLKKLVVGQSVISLGLALFFFGWAVKNNNSPHFNRGIFCFALTAIAATLGLAAGASRRHGVTALAVALTTLSFAVCSFIYGLALGQWVLSSADFTQAAVLKELLPSAGFTLFAAFQAFTLALSAAHDDADESMWIVLARRRSAKALFAVSVVELLAGVGFWGDAVFNSFVAAAGSDNGALALWLPMLGGLCGVLHALDERPHAGTANLLVQVLLALPSVLALFIFELLNPPSERAEQLYITVSQLVIWSALVALAIAAGAVHTFRVVKGQR